MGCQKASILMMEYIDKSISDDDKKELLNHLEACDDCNLEFSLLLETIDLVEEEEEVEVPTEIENMVMSAIDVKKYEKKINYKNYILLTLIPLLVLGGFIGFRIINNYGSVEEVLIKAIVDFTNMMAITLPRIILIIRSNFILIFSVLLLGLLTIATALIVFAMVELYIVKKWKIKMGRNY